MVSECSLTKVNYYMYGMQAFVKIKFNNIVMWLLMRKMNFVQAKITLFQLLTLYRENCFITY